MIPVAVRMPDPAGPGHTPRTRGKKKARGASAPRASGSRPLFRFDYGSAEMDAVHPRTPGARPVIRQQQKVKLAFIFLKVYRPADVLSRRDRLPAEGVSGATELNLEHPRMCICPTHRPEDAGWSQLFRGGRSVERACARAVSTGADARAQCVAAIRRPFSSSRRSRRS